MKYLAILIAFAVGAAISFAEYLVSKYFLVHRPRQFASVSIIRQALSIAYLVVLFFIGQNTNLDTTLLLVGGAIGITVPSFCFTAKLMKLNAESIKKNTKEDDNE